MSELPLFEKVLIWAIPILFAVTLHEVAHGWVAKQLGDRTAEMLGRLTINPIRHIDLIGTVVVPLALLLIGGFVFGWAKPVPVNWNNLNNPKRDMALVAMAGPTANLLMILFWLLVAKSVSLVATDPGSLAGLLMYMSWAGILVNGLLMILNLFPLPPLDGSRVVFALLPRTLAYRYAMIEPYGLAILLILFFTGVLGKILGPLFYGFQNLLRMLLV